MPSNNLYDLEEQLRQDRRLGKARRRKRRLRRALPLLLLLLLAGGAAWLLFGDREETPATTETLAPGSSVATLRFVGDISLNEAMLESFRTEDGRDYDFTPLFRRVVTQLATADLTVGNLEGNVTSNDAAADYKYPVALLKGLYSAGMDVLQTANSYSIQSGMTGLTATKEGIQAAGMEALGTWSSPEDRKENGVLIREVNGIRVAFLAFTKGMNNLRLPEGADYCVNLLYTDYDTKYSVIARSAIIGAVEEARLLAPDVIIALVHWGSEYDRQVTDSQKEIAELLFSCGVHCIIGTHSHYVGPLEIPRRKITAAGGNLIAYSLGDFVSVSDSASARSGCILSLTLVKDGSGIRITDVSYTPTYSTDPLEESGSCEVLDTLDAISFYKQGYYDRVSEKLYERLVSAVEKMREQTGQPDLMVKK